MSSDRPPLFLITGVMAAGKSTVAQALAARFDASAHVRGDAFRRLIVAGRVEMSPSPSPDALAQLRLRYELAAATADRYVEAGFTTVLQDTVLGPMLSEVVAMVRADPLHVVVLAPSVEVVQQREAGRQKTGYTGFAPAELDRLLREATPEIGLWIDSSALTVEQTVDRILDETVGGAA